MTQAREHAVGWRYPARAGSTGEKLRRAVRPAFSLSLSFALALALGLLGAQPSFADDSATVLRPQGGRQWLSPRGVVPGLKTGAVDPVTVRVDKPAYVDLYFVVRYLAMNGQCNRVNPDPNAKPANARVPQEFFEVYRLPSGQTAQTVRIPVDKYTPGRCAWRVEMLGTQAIDSRYQTWKLAWTTGQFFAADGAPANYVERTCRNFPVGTTAGKPDVMLSCMLTDPLTPTHLIKPSGSLLTLKYAMADSERIQVGAQPGSLTNVNLNPATRPGAGAIPATLDHAMRAPNR
ncbi:hypothetical protein [Paraburkholderia sp.]|uniref:hypothetical protein n=1 Tax=Paraburkholderia sp. TaxID=1926495 RepID=UPI0023A5F71E|nr:hypothetical protein [Paraburkholderia sp.]MDE1180553.1 hypothetical protein [Paraburkholderia sp.]